MIVFNNVSKSFDGSPALQNVNLTIRQGEIFGIIGKSGAGKSTLLRSINALEIPDSGCITIANETIVNVKDKQALRKIRQTMAMIFQHFNLLSNKTVAENIALPMRMQGYNQRQIQEKVKELLGLIELSNKAQAYPSQLSGGQKQRVAIARALSCDPKILLCDEATSALDPATTQSILELLKTINHRYGITIVLITHEMEVIKRICHRLSVMEHGAVIETSELSSLFDATNSRAQAMLFKSLSPTLPSSLKQCLSKTENHKPLLKLIFQGAKTTVPFISQCSRELMLDINILLANIDRFDKLTCGVLIVELNASQAQLAQFMTRCQAQQISVEVLGYVHDSDF